MSVESGEERGVRPRWRDAVCRGRDSRPGAGRALIGVLPGEGIGPEVMGAALAVLDAARSPGVEFEIRSGGTMPIGRDAELVNGRALTEEVAAFCQGVFDDGGAVLCGPGGGRFVYDLRRRFDLFCKISPLKPVVSTAPTSSSFARTSAASTRESGERSRTSGTDGCASTRSGIPRDRCAGCSTPRRRWRRGDEDGSRSS